MSKHKKNYLIRKQEIELEKLELEKQELEFRQSRRSRKLEEFKSYAGFSAFITGIVAIVTIGFSVFKWSSEIEQNRNIRVEERLDKTVLNLGSDSAQLRLGSVINLRTFLDKKHEKYHHQVLLSVANILGNEKESSVRSAMIQILSEIDTNIVNNEILEKTLETLIDYSKFHLETGELYRKRINNEFANPAPDSQESIARDISKGILALFRKGIKTKNMSSIFCVKCDFSDLDLEGVSFEDAVLSWSNFSNSNLKNTNFDGADIGQTKFINADLSNSLLTFNEFKYPGYRFHYVEKQLHYDIYQGRVHGPDFTKANLTNADFTGHILFGFRNSTISDGIVIFNPSFRSANLTKTKFKTIGIYGDTFNDFNDSYSNLLPFSPSPYYDCQIGLPHGRLERSPNELNYHIFISIIDSTSKIYPAINKFQKSNMQIYDQLAGSNWKDAIWPKAMKNMLNQIDTELQKIK